VEIPVKEEDFVFPPPPKVETPVVKSNNAVAAPAVKIPVKEEGFVFPPPPKVVPAPPQLRAAEIIKGFDQAKSEPVAVFDYGRYTALPLPPNSGINQSKELPQSVLSMIEINGPDELYRLDNAKVLANMLGVSVPYAYENQDVAIELAMGFPKNAKEFSQIVQQSSQSWGYSREMAALGYDMLQNGYDEEKAARVKELQAQQPNYEELLTNFPRKLVARTLELMPQMAENFAKGGIAGAAAGIGVALLFNAFVGAGTGGAGLAVSVPATIAAFGGAGAAIGTGSTVLMSSGAAGVASGMAAATVAGKAASVMNAGKNEAGLAYVNFIVDMEESGLDENVVRVSSAVIGILNGGIEMTQMDTVIKSFGGMIGKKELQNGLAKSVQKLLINGKYKTALLKYAAEHQLIAGAGKLAAKEIAYIAPETAQEVAQELVNITVSNMAYDWSNKRSGTNLQKTTWDEAVEQLVQVAGQSALAFLGMGVGPVISTARDMRSRPTVEMSAESATPDGNGGFQGIEKKKVLEHAGVDEDTLNTVLQPITDTQTGKLKPSGITLEDINQETGEVSAEVRAEDIRLDMIDQELTEAQSRVSVKEAEVVKLAESEEEGSSGLLQAQSELAELKDEVENLEGEQRILGELRNKPVWEMTQEEYSYTEKLSGTLLKDHFTKKYTDRAADRAAVKTIVESAFPQAKPVDVDTSYQMVSAMAEVEGLSAETYINHVAAPEFYKASNVVKAEDVAESGTDLSQAIKSGRPEKVNQVIDNILEKYPGEKTQLREKLQAIAFKNPVYQEQLEAADNAAIENLRTRLEAGYGDKRPEIGVVTELVRARAKAEGLSVQKYVDESFAEIRAGLDVETQAKADREGKTPKAAARFLEDGRAVIQITKLADLSSFIHEFGHVLRRQLTDAELEKIEKYYGVEDGIWTEDAEELFAVSFEEYIRRGRAPQSDLKTIFQKMAELMGKIYEGIRDQLIFPDEVIEVLDGLFDKDRLQHMATRDTSDDIVFHDAWHGSPHAFSKFTTDAIGTGEGHQTFGWGLYFTDQEAIARHYAEALANKQHIFYDGKEIEKDDTAMFDEPKSSELKDKIIYNIGAYIKSGYDFVAAKIQVKANNDREIRLVDYKDEKKIEQLKETRRIINSIDIKKIEVKKNRNIYKVEIDDNSAWLEWSTQFPETIKTPIKAELEKAGLESNLHGNWDSKNFKTGESLYRKLTGMFMDGTKSVNQAQKDASILLKRAGIDGIKHPATIHHGLYTCLHLSLLHLQEYNKVPAGLLYSCKDLLQIYSLHSAFYTFSVYPVPGLLALLRRRPDPAAL